jgi:hypothetical protein
MSALDTYNSLPDMAKEMVRNKFLSEMRAQFDAAKPAMMNQFVADPNIQAQWDGYLDHTWHDAVANSDVHWSEWLEANLK